MELLYILLVLLVATRIFGELAERIGQPVLVGELVSGIALGLLAAQFEEALPVLSGLEHNEVFRGITDLGMFFLMLYAGVELRPRDLASSSKGALLVAVGGMLLPFCFGVGFGWALLPRSEVKLAQSMFLGTCLAITAVPVSVKILLDLGKLKTRLGQTIVSAALADDILSLLLLALLTSMLATGELPGAAAIALLVAKVTLFFAAVILAGRYLLPAIGSRLHRLKAHQLEFSFLLISGLAFSVLAEALAMHFILGAFAAGLFFGRRTVSDTVFEDVREKTHAISAGFLAPIFFASIGIHLNLRAITAVPGFVLLLIAVATVGKVLGAAIPAWRIGFGARNALAVGVAMNARGAVELIIAGVALRAGLFERPTPPPPVVANLFSAVVLMAVFTTLVTPIALKRILRPGVPGTCSPVSGGKAPGT